MLSHVSHTCQRSDDTRRTISLGGTGLGIPYPWVGMIGMGWWLALRHRNSKSREVGLSMERNQQRLYGHEVGSPLG